MSDLVLGLDIGISSVGWGIINEKTGDIIDAGVRLFEEADRNANEDRRNFRGARRLKRRRKHRLERTRELLNNNELPTEKIQETDPYVARYQGLRAHINKNQLAAALYHLVKRRGTTIDTPEEEDKTSGSKLSTKEQLKRNAELLNTEFNYIVEIQYNKLKNNEPIRTHENRFTTEEYEKEARALLSKQQEYYPEILTKEFVESYIDLLNNRRKYYEGPGSKKSPTPYGRYFLDEDGKLQEESMIEKMRGKGTYFTDEPRIAKRAYTAELFNILNELNNIRYPKSDNGEVEKITSLTQEQKEVLINDFPLKDKNLTLKRLADFLKVSDELTIKGLPLNMKTGKPQFSSMNGLKQLKKYLKGLSLPENFFSNSEVLDEIANILTGEKGFERRIEQLSALFDTHYNDPLREVVDVLKYDTEFKAYHSLSKKGIESILQELWETDKNQMVLFTEKGLGKSRLEKLQGKTNIKFDDNAILSTVAKRAHRETIKVTNEVRKQYGELDYVVVEMAREKNSDEKRKQISQFQRQAGKFEKEMAELLDVDELKDLRLNGKQMRALKFWKEQDGKCIYSGKGISLHEIVKDFSKFEIDHIIPLSYSYDDSQQNKVLCYRMENQDKGQLTPFQYFQSGKAKRSFTEFKVATETLFTSKKISKKKLNYLLEMRDVKNDEEIQKEFINRNLVDTRYAMRSFQQTLRTFYQNNDIDTTVLSIRGSFTSALRRRAKFHKDRDEDYSHHAIDALIVAGIGRMPLLEQFKTIDMNDEGIVIDKETGENLSEREVLEPALKFLGRLKNYTIKRYSHKVDRKPNRTMTNQTLYSTREKDGDKYVVGKVKNIYELDKKGYESLKKRIEKNPDLFLMAQHDPKTWELVRKVMKEHADADNPFQDYREEHGYILKDGKVPVKGLKYLEEKLGIHVDITGKFNGAKNNVILKKRKSIRVDVYMDDKGKYKYLGVPYNWFKKENNSYILDMCKYNGDHGRNASYKKIDDSFEFQFSLYKNDRISYEKEEKIENPETGEKVKKLIKYNKIYRGDYSPRANKIEVKDIYFWDSKQQAVSIGTVRKLFKFNVDVLGNEYMVKKEEFQNVLDSI